MTPEGERQQRIAEAEQLKQSNAAADEVQKRQSIVHAIAYDVKKPQIEKRCRAQAMANTPEAWAKRNDTDLFTGE